MSDYYIKTNGEERGPYAKSQLHSMWGSGAITSDTLFRLGESQDWQPIGRLLDDKELSAPPGVPASSTAVLSATVRPKKSQAGTVAFLIVLLLILAVMFFGNVHIITGGNLDSPRIVKKQSFGMSETFIKIDTITSMPWLAAKSRYPLSCAVLMREHLIESDEEFQERKQKEAKDEMEKALQDLRK